MLLDRPPIPPNCHHLYSGRAAQTCMQIWFSKVKIATFVPPLPLPFTPRSHLAQSSFVLTARVICSLSLTLPHFIHRMVSALVKDDDSLVYFSRSLQGASLCVALRCVALRCVALRACIPESRKLYLLFLPPFLLTLAICAGLQHKKHWLPGMYSSCGGMHHRL